MAATIRTSTSVLRARASRCVGPGARAASWPGPPWGNRRFRRGRWSSCSANSNRAIYLATAPVKAPFWVPEELALDERGRRTARLTQTMALPLRGLVLWMAQAIIFFRSPFSGNENRGVGLGHLPDLSQDLPDAVAPADDLLVALDELDSSCRLTFSAWIRSFNSRTSLKAFFSAISAAFRSSAPASNT